ncbi:hypothetical protein [Nocardia sp. NPDC056000]|uniref:hypothetical protein n=1 Tax=Nocardia sp. NPDC056000 TaxID=3345674 RepID=UPI0035E13DCA
MTRIGVTGHMNITRDSVPLIRQEIDRILSAAGNPEALLGVSCLARGADSVFAQAVLDAGGRLEVVLPSRSYRDRKVTPDHAKLFDELVARAAIVHMMDFQDAGREAYEAANEVVVGTCDKLIAIWDGQPSEKGGTGTVVELARVKGVPVEIIWPLGAARG